jgi:hypothetical protein
MYGWLLVLDIKFNSILLLNKNVTSVKCSTGPQSIQQRWNEKLDVVGQKPWHFEIQR